MPYNFDYVINRLEDGNVRFDILQTSDESVAIMLPDFNRILGVWPDTNKPCPFWINEKFLENPNNTSADWQNPGGHRIWIAPEKEFFISDLKNPFDTYKVPESLDPGGWDYSANSQKAGFTGDIQLYGFRSQKDVNLNLKRTISVLDFDEIKDMIPSDVECDNWFAYEEELELSCCDDFKAGLWSLIQVPLGGDMIIPVKSNGVTLTPFFGDSSGYITLDNDFAKIKYAHNSESDFKVGFTPQSVGNTIYYLRDLDEKHSVLIIQKFTKSDTDEYVDTPWEADSEQGSAIQSFCGSKWGFGELEVHYPANKQDNKQSTSKAKSQVVVAIIMRYKCIRMWQCHSVLI